MLDPRQPDALRNMYPIATRVRIVDFDQLPDGLLGITVLGMERVRITDLWQEADGLRIGEVEQLPLAHRPAQCRPALAGQGAAGGVRRLPGIRGPLSQPRLGRCQLGGPALAGGAADPGGAEAGLVAAEDNQPALSC